MRLHIWGVPRGFVYRPQGRPSSIFIYKKDDFEFVSGAAFSLGEEPFIIRAPAFRSIKQAAQHPQKNLITRAMGVSASIVPEYNRCEISPGDILMLCTDGLTNMVADAELGLILQETAFFDAPGVLVDRALKGGGQDNITVLLMGVETTEGTNG